MQRKEYERKRTAGDASRLRVGVAVSDFNADITGPMLEGALATLSEWGVKDKNISVVHVPGGFELPLAASRFIKRKKADAVVVLGCVIKGETKHDEYISMSVANALQTIMIQTGKPVAFGVITPNTLEQAVARSTGSANKGIEAAVAALTMALQK